VVDLRDSQAPQRGPMDRITDRAHILETGSESYRFRRTIEKRKKGEKTSETK
jgi:hypothetical protein